MDCIFPRLILNDRHKLVRMLRRFLNILVKPTPNLPDNDFVTQDVLNAVGNFKKQWRAKIYISKYDDNHFFEITPGTFAMIGNALGKDVLLDELRKSEDKYEITLLMGMNVMGATYACYTAEMEACDEKIASIFGGKNAVAAANGFDPESLAIVQSLTESQIGHYYRGGFVDRNTGILNEGHLSVHAMHLYGSTDGTRFGVDGNTFIDLFVPDGFRVKTVRKAVSPTQASVDFYYKKLGNYEDVTLLVSHIKDFKLQQVGDRWHLGKIGGKGGQTLNYIHSHLDLFKGDVGMTGKRVRIPFAKAFC